MAKPSEIEARITNYMEKLKLLLVSDLHQFSARNKRTSEDLGGVYIIYDKAQTRILYVGESKHLRRRLFGDHRSGNRRGSAFRRALSKWKNFDNETDIRRYIVQKCSFKILPIPDKLERKRFEHFAIAVFDPKLNDIVKLKIV